MYSLTLEELKERVGSCYDPDLLVELLEINSQEILDSFEDKLLTNRYKFLPEIETCEARENENT